MLQLQIISLVLSIGVALFTIIKLYLEIKALKNVEESSKSEEANEAQKNVSARLRGDERKIINLYTLLSIVSVSFALYIGFDLYISNTSASSFEKAKYSLLELSGRIPPNVRDYELYSANGDEIETERLLNVLTEAQNINRELGQLDTSALSEGLKMHYYDQWVYNAIIMASCHSLTDGCDSAEKLSAKISQNLKILQNKITRFREKFEQENQPAMATLDKWLTDTNVEKRSKYLETWNKAIVAYCDRSDDNVAALRVAILAIDTNFRTQYPLQYNYHIHTIIRRQQDEAFYNTYVRDNSDNSNGSDE